ncbi:MAG: hypothetical protein EHM33_09705, partial [Chloroflexi bacterium]
MPSPITNPGESPRTVDDWVVEYSKRRPLQLQFTAKMEALLRDMLLTMGVDFHLLESRTKTEESFKEKIQRSSKSYLNPINDVTDFTGIRIITYYQEDADVIGQLMESEFVVDLEHSEKRDSAPSEFGYKSAHYVVSIPAERGRLLEWRELAHLKAEVQVRTVLQHAWATISHKLQYKREADIPLVFRRRLFRLSALFELADDEFVVLKKASSELTKSIEEQLEAGERDIAIDYLSVQRFLLHSTDVVNLTSIAIKVGFLFDEDEHEQPRGDSDLVSMMKIIGLASLAQLEAVLQDSLKWSEPYLTMQIHATER